MLNFRAFLVGLSFLIFNLVVAHATPSPEAEKLYSQLQKIGDKPFANDNQLNQAVGAISAIEMMSQADVPDILIQLAMKELTNGRQKKRIIQTLLAAIKNTATVQHVVPGADGNVPALIELQTKLLSIVGSVDFRSHKTTFVQLINESIEQAKNRSPRITAELFPGLRGDVSRIQNEMNEQFQRQFLLEQNLIDPERATETQRAKQYKRFRDEITRLAPYAGKGGKEVKAGSSSAAELVLAGTAKILTDEVAQSIIDNRHFKILGREDVVERLLLVLSRYKQQNAVLVGSKGAGKTSIVELLAEKIVLGMVSDNEVTQFLKDAVILQTTVGKISSLAKTDKKAGQAQAVEEYFRGLKEVQEKIGRRIIIFVDEIHSLTSDQIESIKPILDSSNGGILLVGASTSQELRAAFKYNEAFLRRIEQIAVRELLEEEILHIFKNSWMDTFTKRHGDILLDEEYMRLIIRKAVLAYPDKGTVDAAFIFTDDILNYLRLKLNNKAALKEINASVVYNFVQKIIGLPVDPSQTKALEAYRFKLGEVLKGEVLENERMVEDVLDLWVDLLKNESPRGIRVAAIMGRSGTGKSELATQLAVRALGSKERMFVIDGNEYRDANDIKLSILFGVPGGVSFGQVTSGTLMEWLDDPSKGKHAGIIVINEADKANALFWIRFMEFFDTGRLQGGDNKMRTAHKHLVILTSNRGDKILFPNDIEKMAEDSIRERVNSISEEEIRQLLENKIDESDMNTLPDSIVNRIDLFTVSNIISPRVAKIIARKIVAHLQDKLMEERGVELKVDDRILDMFVERFNPVRRGARPMVRALAKFIDTGGDRLLGRPEVFVDGTGALEIKYIDDVTTQFQYKEHKITRAAPIREKQSEQKSFSSMSCHAFFQ